MSQLAIDSCPANIVSKTSASIISRVLLHTSRNSHRSSQPTTRARCSTPKQFSHGFLIYLRLAHSHHRRPRSKCLKSLANANSALSRKKNNSILPVLQRLSRRWMSRRASGYERMMRLYMKRMSMQRLVHLPPAHPVFQGPILGPLQDLPQSIPVPAHVPGHQRNRLWA